MIIQVLDKKFQPYIKAATNKGTDREIGRTDQ